MTCNIINWPYQLTQHFPTLFTSETGYGMWASLTNVDWKEGFVFFQSLAFPEGEKRFPVSDAVFCHSKASLSVITRPEVPFSVLRLSL